MTGADLSDAQLDGIYGAGVSQCPGLLPGDWRCLNRNLVGPRAFLFDCDLAGQNLGGMSLMFALIDGCDLSGADLSGALLANVTLNESSLIGADLDGVYMHDARILECDLTGASMAGADIDYMDWTDVTCPDGVSTEVSFTCCGHHVGGAPAVCDD